MEQIEDRLIEVAERLTDLVDSVTHLGERMSASEIRLEQLSGQFQTSLIKVEAEAERSNTLLAALVDQGKAKLQMDQTRLEHTQALEAKQAELIAARQGLWNLLIEEAKRPLIYMASLAAIWLASKGLPAEWMQTILAMLVGGR